MIEHDLFSVAVKPFPDLFVPPVCSSDLFSDQDQSPAAEEVLVGLQVDLLVPYSRLAVSSWSELPDSCLSFGVKASPTRWYVFSEAEELRRTRTELKTLLQVRTRQFWTHLLVYSSK